MRTEQEQMIRRLQKLSILTFLITLCCALPAGATPLLQPEQQAQQSIDTLYRARTTIISHHLERGKDRPVSPTEESDFRLFLSYLDGRILYYCEQLLFHGGSAALSDTPCPVAADGMLETSSYSMLPADKSRTEQEKAAALERELQDSFGTFDDMLLKEQEQIAANVAKQREGSAHPSHPAADGDTTGSYQDKQAGSTRQTETKTGSSEGTGVRAAKPGGTNRGSTSGSTRQTRVPPTAGSKDLSQNDDDIVARQLREAAEQETDPEVQAKLWEEYRKYKQGVN